MASTARRQHKAATELLVKLQRQLRDFEEAEAAWGRALRLPIVLRTNEGSKESRSVSKQLAHTNPQRERSYAQLGDAQKVLRRSREQLLEWEDDPAMRELWVEVSDARGLIDRCMERLATATAQYKTPG